MHTKIFNFVIQPYNYSQFEKNWLGFSTPHMFNLYLLKYYEFTYHDIAMLIILNIIWALNSTYLITQLETKLIFGIIVIQL